MQFIGKFKAKVALEAIKGIKTLSQIASDYKVSPTQISTWRKTLIAESPESFSRKSDSVKTEEEISAPLFEEIGRLKMDIKWLKKKL
jgi:putative transposase